MRVRWLRICPCEETGSASASVLPTGHRPIAPELLYLMAKLAALMPFGKVAMFLDEVLPTATKTHASTVRNRTLRVGQLAHTRRPSWREHPTRHTVDAATPSPASLRMRRRRRVPGTRNLQGALTGRSRGRNTGYSRDSQSNCYTGSRHQSQADLCADAVATLYSRFIATLGPSQTGEQLLPSARVTIGRFGGAGRRDYACRRSRGDNAPLIKTSPPHVSCQ